MPESDLQIASIVILSFNFIISAFLLIVVLYFGYNSYNILRELMDEYMKKWKQSLEPRTHSTVRKASIETVDNKSDIQSIDSLNVYPFNTKNKDNLETKKSKSDSRRQRNTYPMRSKVEDSFKDCQKEVSVILEPIPESNEQSGDYSPKLSPIVAPKGVKRVNSLNIKLFKNFKGFQGFDGKQMNGKSIVNKSDLSEEKSNSNEIELKSFEGPNDSKGRQTDITISIENLRHISDDSKSSFNSYFSDTIVQIESVLDQSFNSLIKTVNDMNLQTLQYRYSSDED